MAQPERPEHPEHDDEPTLAHGNDDEEPTVGTPTRWTGSAPVPETQSKRRRRGVLREPTAELPTVDGEDDPWPPPPPPRPANSPVTVPYPPPRRSAPAPPAPLPPTAPRPPAVRPRAGGSSRGPHPPRYVPYAGYPPPPPPRRRRRRWPWMFGLLALLTLLCCGCCWNWARPYLEEYPSTATLGPQAAGLVMLDDAASKRRTAALEAEMRGRNWLADQVFAGVYAEQEQRARRVTVYGVTAFIWNPKNELNGAFADLTKEYALTGTQELDPGPPGGLVRCAEGSSAGQDVVVCGWSDHGSLAIGVFTDRPVTQAADLFRDLRAAIIARG